MLTTAVVLAALLAPAQATPGHILPAGTPDAVCTSGHVGTAVTFGRYRASSQGEDWNEDNYANPWGAGAFFWAPGGRQTSDYLKVTTTGASLVDGASQGTVFVPLARSGGFEILGTLANGYPSSGEVLTDRGGRLILAPEGGSGQLWAVGP